MIKDIRARSSGFMSWRIPMTREFVCWMGWTVSNLLMVSCNLTGLISLFVLVYCSCLILFLGTGRAPSCFKARGGVLWGVCLDPGMADRDYFETILESLLGAGKGSPSSLMSPWVSDRRTSSRSMTRGGIREKPEASHQSWWLAKPLL